MSPTVTRSADLPWTPLHEEGVRSDGVFVKPLRRDATGRPPSFLLRFEPGASYAHHVHPAGEEVFVLEGEVRFGNVHLHAGDYLYTPPGEAHSVYSKSGCVLFFLVPEEVELSRPHQNGLALEHA